MKGAWFVVCGVLLAAPVAAQSGEVGEWGAEQVRDVRTVGEKFIALAEAFPEETYDWRPMEGVRSVREVFGLMVAEFYLFPTVWGAAPPQGISRDWQVVMDETAALSKEEIVQALRTSLDHLMGTIEGRSARDRQARADWFGRPVTTEAAIGLAAGDMHEHLGQAIAYARSNRVVPPWSR